ncbi:MAG: NAD(+) synthase [Desulfobacteraceae bacterium 4572_130]|nr:MAG: NAD(+) synthase [Desulfobacteraceae bacterium 4572_130]
MKTTKVINYIVKWLKNYADKSGLKGFVVGVSGGIDSAVTSSLCAKTNKKVIVLNMPIYKIKKQESLSLKHIAWLKKKYKNVKSFNIELTKVFKALKTVLPYDIQDKLTIANTHSRLRMLTLYAFASHNKMLVTGTGNKIEDFGIGFYTKYGDGGVDISPIADIMKLEVYKLGKQLGIIDDILQAPPTDGLWEDGRSDETQIGATYKELEWAMEFNSDNESSLNSRQKKVLSIYRKFNQANKHKMKPIPICTIPRKLMVL